MFKAQPYLMALTLTLAVSALPALSQSLNGPDSLIARRDSLERVIRQNSITAADKIQLSQCARTKRSFLVERRLANPEVAKVDSALRAVKLSRVSPDSPEAAKLMERKYSLEQGFEQAWMATTEGKRCALADTSRQARGDAALQASPAYQHLLKRLKQEGML